jgi:hypothetical protein
MPKLYHQEGEWIVPGQQAKHAIRADIPSTPAELAHWLNERKVAPQRIAASEPIEPPLRIEPAQNFHSHPGYAGNQRHHDRTMVDGQRDDRPSRADFHRARGPLPRAAQSGPIMLKTRPKPMNHLATFDNAYRVANQLADANGRNYAIVRNGDRHQVREYPCCAAIAVIRANDGAGSVFGLAS